MLNSVTELPFNRYVGIRTASTEEGLLELPAGEHYLNHLGTVHASAQLALAEACSGEFLLQTLKSDVAVVPVVRRVEAKFKKPAHGRIVAKVTSSITDMTKALEDLTKKGRCLLTIAVDVHDEQGQHSLAASFEWFIAKANAN